MATNGTIFDAVSGTPLQGVSVTLSDKESGITETVTSGAGGGYVLTNDTQDVPDASITFSKSGYLTSNHFLKDIGTDFSMDRNTSFIPVWVWILIAIVALFLLYHFVFKKK